MSHLSMQASISIKWKHKAMTAKLFMLSAPQLSAKAVNPQARCRTMNLWPRKFAMIYYMG